MDNGIPPTHISQLPPDYKTLFQVAGKDIADFDPLKTWIEYFNRLVGVIIGLLVFAVFIFSIYFWQRDKWLTLLSFGVLVLTGFEGWLGSVVVATDLKPFIVTLHMFPALLIVSLLIYIYHRSNPKHQVQISSSGFKILIFVSLGLILIQIILGTQVREMVDVVALKLGNQERASWIESLGTVFYIHRTFFLAIGSKCFYI